MHAIRGPAGIRPFRVSNSRCRVLDNVAFDVLPVPVAKRGVVIRTQLDGEDSVLTEDIRSESGQPSLTLIVRGLSYEVGLVETYARTRNSTAPSELSRSVDGRVSIVI